LVQYSEWLNSITTFCAYYDLARAAANIKYMQDIRSDLLSFTGGTGDSGDTVDLYRAVGVREYESIQANGAFLPGGNSLEGRQFAFTETEALKYANTDLSKVAIVKVTIPKDVLTNLDFSKSIDPNIFNNWVVTVQPETNAIFNNSIIRIEILD